MKSSARGAVVLVGAGRMGGALLKGWITAKRFSRIHVIEPAPSVVVRALARQKKIALAKSFDRLPKADAVIIAVKPQVLKGEGAFLAGLGQMKALTLSIAAGVTTAYLAEKLGTDRRLIRAMPNTPGAIGKGITALYAKPGLKTADRKLAEALMDGLGETLWLKDEALMDAVTAVSGSGPAYVFLLAEALVEAAKAQGLDPGTAARLARATVSGAGALLAADSREPDVLRKEVTSPGGTTEAALKVLMGEKGMVDVMKRGVDAAAKRSKELGK